jgi:hypothetical protein
VPPWTSTSSAIASTPFTLTSLFSLSSDTYPPHTPPHFSPFSTIAHRSLVDFWDASWHRQMRHMIESACYIRADRKPRDNGPRRGGGVCTQAEVSAQPWKIISSQTACIAFICGLVCCCSKRCWSKRIYRQYTAIVFAAALENYTSIWIDSP